jgi:hypothetical protein
VHLTQHEPVAGGRVLDAGRVHVGGHLVHASGQPDVGGVGEPGPERDGQLPRGAADRQREALVRGDVDVEHVVAQARVLGEVGANGRGRGGGWGVGRQHQDPGMIVPDPELGRRADHALGRPPVGLAGADLHASGQHRPGQGQRHPVPDGEVHRAADHVLLAGAGVDRAVPDGLLELGQLLDLGHLGHHDAARVLADLLDGLDLQAGRGEPPRHLGGVGVGPDGRVLEQPRQRNPHHASIPNARLNRTSPSTVSLMSSTPCRIISVRSIPSPNANPL